MTRHGFYCPEGTTGQITSLGEFAGRRPIAMVVLSIGGNNFRFADVVQECVMSFLNGRQTATRWAASAYATGTGSTSSASRT